MAPPNRLVCEERGLFVITFATIKPAKVFLAKSLQPEGHQANSAGYMAYRRNGAAGPAPDLLHQLPDLKVYYQ